ncbi:MAG: TM2 domain-containing protein, partial [Muribaculaceae bacterium]|nr:TM2 domain-containing protein [Muribaculaceae bacterium]
SKSKVAAALLAFFLGSLGIHEFYLGRTGAGIAFLLATLLTGWLIFPLFIIGTINLIQTIYYLCMSDAQFAAKYH